MATSTAQSGIRQRSETLLSLSVLAIVAIMLIPLPPIALDLLLATNLSCSILLLLITLGVKRALDLSVFPSLLLMLTLYRLSLNVASTRRILLSADGGNLVDAFGSFVVGGNLIVGFVVFMILIVIQFVVITKGSGRVSEVSARFTLDALPGKQISIDADLNAGVITEQQAKLRREELGQETEFYGAMDGASKFVRGDAIAGLIITAINLIGGIIIGVSNGQSVLDSIRTYSILTIGDGLVSQIPALIISVTSGILVTKMTSKDSLGQEISDQMFENDRPLWIGIAFMVLLVLVPGLPKFPFLTIAGGLLIVVSRGRSATAEPEDDVTKFDPEQESAEDEVDLQNFLLTERATIDVGARLLSLIKPKQTKGLAERIRVLRQQFSQERGLWIPPIRVRSSFELDADTYRIVVAGRVVGEGVLRTEHKLAIPPTDAKVVLPGEQTTEPTFGLPAIWIEPSLSKQAETHGYTVVDASGVMITHLHELLKRHGHELLTRESLKDMIAQVQEFAPSIVEEIKSENVRMSLLHQVVKQLAAENVSLADFSLVLEAIANHAASTKSPDELTDAVRQELGHVICQRYLTRERRLRVIACEPALETQLQASLHNGQLALPPDALTLLTERIGNFWQDAVRLGEPLALLTHSPIRRALRRQLAAVAPQLGVLTYHEIPDDMETEVAGIVQGIELEVAA